MKNEERIGAITVAGQPTAEELAVLPQRFRTVINLRMPDEDGNESAAALAGAPIRYFEVPFTKETITPEHIRQIAAILAEAEDPVLVH